MNIRFFFALLTIFLNIYSVDLVIFSYDRPIQLYALLESIEKYITGLSSTAIVYRTSSERFEKSYEKVKNRFKKADYLKQGNAPEQDFKPLTIKIAFGGKSDYVLFAVDDIIVKDFVDLSDCIQALEKNDAYGFYLRMGSHLVQSYLPQDKQKLPPFTELGSNILMWNISEGKFDWAYPNTVDMTLYRKKDLEDDFREMTYSGPNTLESEWSCKHWRVGTRPALCFDISKVVNIPLNRVQSVMPNPHMNYMNTQQLLELFENGKKIDITPFFKMRNAGSHMDYVPQFVDRHG